MAVGAFALYSFRISNLPADDNHHFGHDKISFISSGIKGVLILVATAVVLVECISRLVHNSVPEDVGRGALLMACTVILNGALGLVLLKVGKRHNSLIIKASGQFILADVWTTIGVVLGLGAYKIFHLGFLDSAIGLGFAAFLVKPGIDLIKQSVLGLMDATNKILEKDVEDYLDAFCRENSCRFHRLRLRESGNTVHIDFHLQFPDDTPLPTAHSLATKAESQIKKRMMLNAEIVSHIEPFTIPSEDQDAFDRVTR